MKRSEVDFSSRIGIWPLFDWSLQYEVQGDVNASEGGLHWDEKIKVIYQRNSKIFRSGQINNLVHCSK